jgi:E3 ubiquitin-protein ligase HECTD3
MRYDQWWECKFIAEGIIDQGEALRENDTGPVCCPIRTLETSGITI